MGQTLAIWKWRALWPFRSDARVMRSIGQDWAPLALERFDANGLADEIRTRFGGGDEPPFVVEVCDFAGNRANWLMLSAGWGVGRETMDALLQLCAERGVHVFAEG